MGSPTLTDVLIRAVENRINDMHTSLPGRIESYDHKKQKASVKPLIKKKYRDGEVESLPVIVNVPVVWPRSSKASLTFPVNKGDLVLLIFSERSLENYLALGGEQEPGDVRKYDLTDAIAIPGLYPFSGPSLSENNEDVLLIYNATKIRIKKNGTVDMEISNDETINIKNNRSHTIGGKSTVNITGDSEVTIGGNGVLSVTGDVSATIAGKCTLDVSGNLSGTIGGSAVLDVTSNATCTIGGSASIDVTGGVTLNAGSDVDITAPNVNITGNLTVSGQTDLAGGGPGIARSGDSVEVTVNVTGGSSAGSYSGTGTITSGSGSSRSG